MIHIFFILFLVLVHIFALIAEKSRPEGVNILTNYRVICLLFLGFVFPLIFQYVMFYFSEPKVPRYNVQMKFILYILFFSPLIETSMIGGISAIFKFFKIDNILYFILFSLAFWGLIHNPAGYKKMMFISFGFGVMSYIYIIALKERGKLVAFFIVSILHAIANFGMMVAFFVR